MTRSLTWLATDWRKIYNLYLKKEKSLCYTWPFLRDSWLSPRREFKTAVREKPASARAPSNLPACNLSKHKACIQNHQQLGYPTDFVPRWDNFTHRLCDKNRDSASLLIRLFFRPSNIADAAISIFELPPTPSPKRIQDIRSTPRNQSTCSPIFREISPAGNRRSYYPRALPLSPNGDALYVPVADPLAARRYISFHVSPPSRSLLSFAGLFALEEQTFLLRLVFRDGAEISRCNDGRCSYANLSSLRWIDSMFSLTQVIHLSCFRRPRAIDPDVRRWRVGLPSRTNKLDLSFLDRQPPARSFLLHLSPLAAVNFFVSQPDAHFSIPSPFSSSFFRRPALSRFFVFISAIIRAPPVVRVFILNEIRERAFRKETSSTSSALDRYRSEVRPDALEVQSFYLTQFPSGWPARSLRLIEWRSL